MGGLAPAPIKQLNGFQNFKKKLVIKCYPFVLVFFHYETQRNDPKLLKKKLGLIRILSMWKKSQTNYCSKYIKKKIC